MRIHVAQGRAQRRTVNEDHGSNEPSCSERRAGGGLLTGRAAIIFS